MPTEDDAGDRTRDLIAIGAAGATAGSVAVPPLGLLAGALILADRIRERRHAATVKVMEDTLEAVRDHVDQTFVRSDEFAELAEEVAEKASQRREMEKREFYAAALANSALPKRPSEDDRFRMIDILERLSVSQLRILSLFHGRLGRAAPPGTLSSMKAEIIALMPAANEHWDRFEVDYNALLRDGLVSALPSGTMTAANASSLHNLLTDLGKLFHQFVKLPFSDVHPPD